MRRERERGTLYPLSPTLFSLFREAGGKGGNGKNVSVLRGGENEKAKLWNKTSYPCNFACVGRFKLFTLQLLDRSNNRRLYGRQPENGRRVYLMPLAQATGILQIINVLILIKKVRK